jgi:hypothetical protein
MVFVATSLDCFGINKFFYDPFSIIKRFRLVDHPKTGQIGLVLGWSILGYPVLVNMDHPKIGLVRFSDPHCICFLTNLLQHRKM